MMLSGLILAYLMLPPKEFPDRLADLSTQATTIDNTFYDVPNMAAQWWGESTKDWAYGLHRMNPARVGYFIRKISQHFHGIQPENLTLADIGCGGGIASEALARSGYHVLGFDLSENSLEQARRHANANNISNVEYHVGSAYDIPLKNSSVDVVVMTDVLGKFCSH
jgi:2-polyprenyl-6-hydroxyphenyl methylase/3-demethylubiquinone-9 3-methyltransferase